MHSSLSLTRPSGFLHAALLTFVLLTNLHAGSLFDDLAKHVESHDYIGAVDFYYSHQKEMDAAMEGESSDGKDMVGLLLKAFHGIGDYNNAIAFRRKVNANIMKERSAYNARPGNEGTAIITKLTTLTEELKLWREAGNLAQMREVLNRMLEESAPAKLEAVKSKMTGDNVRMNSQATCWMMRGVVLGDAARLEEAMGDYTKALEYMEERYAAKRRERDIGLGDLSAAMKREAGVGLDELRDQMELLDKARILCALDRRHEATEALDKAMAVRSLKLNRDGNDFQRDMDSSLKRSALVRATELYARLGQFDKFREIAKIATEAAYRQTSDKNFKATQKSDEAAIRLSLEKALGRGEMMAGDAKAAFGHWKSAAALVDINKFETQSDSIAVHENLAWCALSNGDTKLARQQARAADALFSGVLKNAFTFSNERQRLGLLQTADPFSLFASLGMAPELAAALVKYKGVVLDSVMEERRLALSGPSTGRAYSDLLAKRKEFLELSQRGGKNAEAEIRRLSDETNRLAQEIARGYTSQGQARRSLEINVSDVQKALPADAVLVDYIRVRHPDTIANWRDRYGAVVIAPQGPVQWFDLGAAAEIDASLAALAKNIQDSSLGTKTWSDEMADQALKAQYRTLVAPLLHALPSSLRSLILSPDSNLQSAPFCAFLDSEGHFLCERWNIRMVAAARDLLSERTPGSSVAVFAIGDPDYSHASTVHPGHTRGTSANRLTLLDAATLSKQPLPPLPGTRVEVEALGDIAKRHGWEFHALYGSEAAEANLRHYLRDHSPPILHLGTHALHMSREGVSQTTANSSPLNIPMDSANSPAKKGKDDNTSQWLPMLPLSGDDPLSSSALVLAGANQTFSAWARGVFPPSDNDGILTADELIDFNLGKTDVVVLSACETGLGASLSSQGSWGFRRSLTLAGARSVVTTLWSISDDQTVAFMKEFYDRISNPASVVRAFSEAQRECLLRFRKSDKLANAVVFAAPFVMTTTGSQTF